MTTAESIYGDPVIEPATTTRYIGVGAGEDQPFRFVTTTRQGPLSTGDMVEYQYTEKQQFAFKYKEGMEWSLFAAAPRGYIGEVQRKLVDAGLLSTYTSEEWDPASAKAMAVIMEMSNYNGLTWDQTLARVLAAGGFQKVGATSSRGGGLATPTMTDEDIRTVANKTAQGVLGRNLREDEITGFVPAFRSMFAGGTSAQTASETVVREQVAPDEAAAYGLGNVMQSIGSLLGGTMGGAG